MVVVTTASIVSGTREVAAHARRSTAPAGTTGCRRCGRRGRRRPRAGGCFALAPPPPAGRGRSRPRGASACVDVGCWSGRDRRRRASGDEHRPRAAADVGEQGLEELTRTRRPASGRPRCVMRVGSESSRGRGRRRPCGGSSCASPGIEVGGVGRVGSSMPSGMPSSGIQGSRSGATARRRCGGARPRPRRRACRRSCPSRRGARAAGRSRASRGCSALPRTWSGARGRARSSPRPASTCRCRARPPTR